MYGMLVPAGGGEPLQLMKPKLIVGRHPECDLVIASKSVSGRHCRLEFVAGIWRVVDLDSRNGTGVNGKRCRKAKVLPGQTLNVAKRRFQIDYVAPAPENGTLDDDLALEFLKVSDSQEGLPTRSTQSLPMNVQKSASQPSSLTCPNPLPRPTEGQPPGAVPVGGGPLGMLLPAGGGAPHPLHNTNLIVGRSRRCDIRINMPTLSSQHCRLELIGGYWVVEDLGSRNGIRVDGIRYRRKCIVPGAELSLSRESFILDYSIGSGVPPAIDEAWFKDSTGGRPPTSSLLDRAGLTTRDIRSIRNDPDEPNERKIYTLTDEDT